VVGRLREQNQPMGTWEVRGALSRLEADGTIVLDPASASWRMAEARSRKAG
jgi:DNA-binding GntR family transcriptional regulator